MKVDLDDRCSLPVRPITRPSGVASTLRQTLLSCSSRLISRIRRISEQTRFRSRMFPLVTRTLPMPNNEQNSMPNNSQSDNQLIFFPRHFSSLAQAPMFGELSRQLDKDNGGRPSNKTLLTDAEEYNESRDSRDNWCRFGMKLLLKQCTHC
jgi:hypothetical protein